DVYLSDQYGFDNNGILVEPVMKLLGVIKSDFTLEQLLAALGKYRTEDGYDLPDGYVKVAIKVGRKAVPVLKQSIFTVVGVTEQLVPGYYYPFSTSSVVEHTKPTRGGPVGKTVEAVMLSLYGTNNYNPATPVARLKCSYCDYYGWTPLKDIGTVNCLCGAEFQLTSSCVDAESAGVIKPGCVMLLDKSPGMRLIPGNRTYVSFGGAIWSPIGKVNGVTVWVPRAYSIVAGEHSGAVGSGDTVAINKELVEYLIEGIRVDADTLDNPTCATFIANLDCDTKAPVVHTVESLQGLCLANKIMLGDKPLPTDEFHPFIVGLAYHVQRACWYGALASRTFEAFRDFVRTEEERFAQFFGKVCAPINGCVYLAYTTGRVTLFSAYQVLNTAIAKSKDAFGGVAAIVVDMLKPILEWVLKKMSIAKGAWLPYAEGLLALFKAQFTVVKGKFQFLRASLNSKCHSLCDLLTTIMSKLLTSVKWAGCKVDALYTGTYYYFSRKGVLTEVQLCAKRLGLLLTPKQQKMEVEVLDGDFDAPVTLTDLELEECTGVLEEVFGASDVKLVKGTLVSLASKLFVRTEDGFLYRYVKSGGVLGKAFRLRGG
nr:nsp2 [Rousettus bat coronavirus HKU9]